MKYVMSFTFLLMACSAVNSEAATVPCSKLHEASTMTIERCPSPFLEGLVEGQWVGLVLDYVGGAYGTIDSAAVYSVGNGGGATKTFFLGTIKGEDNFGNSGDLIVRFVAGKLWVINPLHYSASEGHGGFTHALVRQYGFYGPSLTVEKRAIIAVSYLKNYYSLSNEAIAAALQRQ